MIRTSLLQDVLHFSHVVKGFRILDSTYRVYNKTEYNTGENHQNVCLCNTVLFEIKKNKTQLIKKQKKQTGIWLIKH